jgi:hypothetical protein
MVPEAKIFAGRHTIHLAAQIAKQYGVPMGNVKITARMKLQMVIRN